MVVRLPTYGDNDPKGWGGDPQRGAALGRGEKHSESKGGEIKFVLQRIRLDNGGYDRNGTYFGHGAPLYWYANATGAVDAMLRAVSREDAKQQIRALYPRARFYR